MRGISCHRVSSRSLESGADSWKNKTTKANKRGRPAALALDYIDQPTKRNKRKRAAGRPSVGIGPDKGDQTAPARNVPPRCQAWRRGRPRHKYTLTGALSTGRLVTPLIWFGAAILNYFYSLLLHFILFIFILLSSWAVSPRASGHISESLLVGGRIWFRAVCLESFQP